MNDRKQRRAVVALGMFDGMHRGHEALIRHAAEKAKRLDARPVVFTFANHPLEVLGRKPRLLTTLDERVRRMRDIGVAEIAAEPFTAGFAAMAPEAFLNWLLARWPVAALVCGFNYTYGRNGEGTADTLIAAGEARGFSVEVLPPVLEENAPISSTRIRKALEAGDVTLANRMLGRPYSLAGVVVPNLQNGRRIGFPTANIEPDGALVLPGDGVYRTRAEVLAGSFPAVTNVGANPTLHAKKETVETHLIGFDRDLYGQRLTVSFLEYLRGEVAFDSLDQLKRRISLDVEAVKRAEHKPEFGK